MIFRRASVLSAILLWCAGCVPVKHEPVVVPTALLTRIDVRYPPQAVRERHQGTVILLTLVDEKGMPAQILVQRSSGFRELDRAAIGAAKQWVYRPETADGVPRQSYARTPINFFLPGLPPVASPQPNQGPAVRPGVVPPPPPPQQ
jgi:TonB family protein